MKKAYLEMGYVCNNLCKHCFVPQTQKKQDLTTEQIKKILLKMKRDGFGVVAFTGGEPTLRKDLFTVLNFSKSIGIKVIEIQTNGRMLCYEDYVNKIKNSGISKVCISIHSHNPEHHDYITQSKGSYEQTISGIKNSLKMGIPIMTNTVIPIRSSKSVNPLFIILFIIAYNHIFMSKNRCSLLCPF